MKTNANEDSDDTFDTGGDDIVIEEEVEEQIDPRWNELKKILDNNELKRKQFNLSEIADSITYIKLGSMNASGEEKISERYQECRFHR